MILRSIPFLLLLCAATAAAVPYDQPFQLPVGQSAAIGADGVRVGFTGVESDSRCPFGVVCIWEGDAAAALWIEGPGLPREDFVLHTFRDWDRELDFGAWRVALLQVAPYPVAGEPIDPAAYVVTLRVSVIGVVPDHAVRWGSAKGRYR